MLIWLLAVAADSPLHDSRCDSTRQDDLIACVEARLEKADAALNAQWKKLPRSTAIVRAQRAWIAFRDAECDAANPTDPTGREYLIHKIGCQANLTEQRAKQLRDNYYWLAE